MSCFSVPEILMPGPSLDASKWCVVACDQYTSQREYWRETEQIVGSAPSALRMILPEAYLEDADKARRIEAINAAMNRYLAEGVLAPVGRGFVLTERDTGRAFPRRGLIVSVDLECYEYAAGTRSLVRPTEKTVVERIPPRLAIRRDAPVELPHIMVLIDNPERDIIEPLFEAAHKLAPLYDHDLMQGGGHIRGWFLPEGEATGRVLEKLDGLIEPERFADKYQLTEPLPPLCCAVGDGNHSLATAKAHWEALKGTLSAEEQKTHPARYCLCELVNIHDESLVIEPIHRVLFHADPDALLAAAVRFYEKHGCSCSIQTDFTAPSDAHVLPFVTADRTGALVVTQPCWGLHVATLQAFLDNFLASHPETKIDYIHGGDVLRRLSCEAGNIGFPLPAIAKQDLFRGVILDGVLPRKTFSMGEAYEKRYYLEAKRIVP